MVHQQTRTVRGPTHLPSAKSYVNRNPQDLLSSSIQGTVRIAFAGCTTLTVAPVANRPTTECNKLVLSGIAIIPYVPDAACNCRRTFLTVQFNLQIHGVQATCHRKYLPKPSNVPGSVVNYFSWHVKHELLVRKRRIAPFILAYKVWMRFLIPAARYLLRVKGRWRIPHIHAMMQCTHNGKWTFQNA